MKFTKSDKAHIADYIIDQHRTRKNDRSHFDAQVREIDRQLRMEPDPEVIKERNGTKEEAFAWMAEAELPLQSQTLEVTEADVMRMLLPRSGPWFEAHAMVTDAYLEAVDFTSIITGDENDIPTKMTQMSTDKLAHGILNHWHSQYNFRGHLSMIIGESIKYSMGIGRARVANRRIFLHTSKGVVKKQMEIPILVPRSIKNVFLDNSEVSMMNEGHIVAPAEIFVKKMRLKDIQMAAEKGNSNTDDILNGGWIKNALKGLEAEDKAGNVEFLEWEGDMVVPRKTTESLYLPNAIITVIIGKSGRDADSRIIRIRKNKTEYSSYIEFPFHREHIDNPYGSSPCMKGRPVQKAAVFALNRLLEASAYNAQPAIRHDTDTEEPQVYPGAYIESDGDIDVLQIGNPVALSGVYASFLAQYADVTGVNAPRLGAQTVSHTTAFAKDAELQRGQARTVDFVEDVLSGPLERWLDIEYELTRLSMKGEVNILLPEWNGYVTISKKYLPEEVSFTAHGSNGPAEEQQQKAIRLQALNQAVQMDSLKMQQQAQLGQQPTPTIDLEEAIRQTLKDGGWIDVDAILTPEQAPPSPPEQPIEANPGLAVAATQGLNFG